MKHLKIILFLLLAVMVTQLMSAYDFMVNGLCYVKNSDGTSVTVTYKYFSSGSPTYSDISGALIIPTSVTYYGKTYSVTSIGDRAFSSCSGLTSVTIPNSVTEIGEWAFIDCSSLTSVNIPNSVTTIGQDAFYRCTGLTEVNIGNSVTSIGQEAFSNCSGLTNLRIEDGTTNLTITTSSSSSPFTNCPLDTLHIGRNIKCSNSSYLPFKGNTSIKYLTIGNSVTSIGSNAFEGCTGLTEVTIGNSVTSIGNYAFRGCTGLTEVTIGNSVTEIGANAFWSCTGLTSVTIPNSVTEIGEGAFRGCTGLTEVTIPNSVTEIGEWAFAWCTGLTEVTIGNSVTSIGREAFYVCTGLTSVAIPNSVTNIGVYAFSGCKGLTSVTIPNSVTTIGNFAFSGCTGLTSVTIPNSVTTIGNFAFEYCTGLTSIIVENGNTKYDSRNNCNAIIETATNKLIQGCNNTIIPNSVTSIGGCAFENCSGLTSVTIPNSVTEIGSQAFSSCTGLTNLRIEDGTTNLTMTTYSSSTPFTNCPLDTLYIGRNIISSASSYPPFKGNTGIKYLIIGDSVTSIGSKAFNGCSELRTIYCEIPEPLTINSDVFSNYYATLYVFDSYIDRYKAKSPWKNFINVLLDDRYISSLQFAQDRMAISLGETKQLNVSVVPDYYDGDKSIGNWTTSDETLVSVDANGLIRGVGVGTASITATSNGKNYKSSNVSASCVIQVMYPTEGAGTGDVNEDGKIDITDATLIISYLQGNTPSAVLDESLMDVTGDGDINMSDVLKVISLIRNDN